MKTDIPLLQNVRVAAPCHAAWDGMQEIEGDRVHFCDQCQKRVYNLSAMGQAEAEGLLRRHEGHLCVRYYRRTDGTILTTDCPLGLKAARTLAFHRAQMSFAACILFCIGFAIHRATLQSAIHESPHRSAQSLEAQTIEYRKALEKNQSPSYEEETSGEFMGLVVRIDPLPTDEIPKPNLNFAKPSETQIIRKQE